MSETAIQHMERRDLVSIRNTLRSEGPDGLAESFNQALRCDVPVTCGEIARARNRVRQTGKHGLADKMNDAIYEVN